MRRPDLPRPALQQQPQLQCALQIRERRGQPSQITAFEDTWHWGETAEATLEDLVANAPDKVVTAITALLELIDRNQMMAYLVMMTARLVELHRVLKPTGSLYLHCDPTASHYLKIILDTIFGGQNYRNEVIWSELGRTTTQCVMAALQTRYFSTRKMMTLSGTHNLRRILRSTFASFSDMKMIAGVSVL